MKNIGKIIKISKPLYKLFLILSVLILSTAIIDLISPIISKFIIDEIVNQIQNDDGNFRKLIILIAVSFAVNILSVTISAVSERIGDHTAGRLRKFLTEKFYNKVLTLPQAYFDSELSGKIVNQLNRGIVSIQSFSNTASNFILPSILQSIFTIIILSYYNVSIGFFVFLLFPIYIFFSYLSTKKWGEEEVKKNKIEDIGRGRIQEAILNIKLVKGFNNEKREHEFITEKQSQINDIYAKQSRIYHIYDFLRNTSLHIVLLLINIVVFYNTYQGNLTIGEMVLIIQLVLQARRPLFGMSFILTQVQNAESGSKEYFDILELEGKEFYDSKEKLSRVKNPILEFRNVSFNYEGGGEVLHDISFNTKQHETIALVGHSGAGKSTIVNLMVDFYDPTNGEILLNGKKYSELSHKFIRNNISLVFQENELFSSTIRENVSYGQDASEEEIIRALKLANAYDFVMKFPKKLDSLVGERGVKLSGGQKQRIQIARAILRNAPILILDEATSSLDSKSESEIQNALENLMKDKLVVIIAHRFSTIQNVDRIIVIDDGRIIDQGKPQELAKKDGIYSELLRYQIEGNEKLLKNYEIY